MQRLAYRILSAKAPLFAEETRKALSPNLPYWKDRFEILKRLLAEVPILQVDNVAKYYAEHSRLEWQGTDVPNWTSPFRQCFVEWEMPRKWASPEGIKIEPEGRLAGAFVYQIDLWNDPDRNADTTKHIGNITEILAGLMGATKFENQIPEYGSIIASARWIVFMDGWSSSGRPPINGLPFSLLINVIVFVDENGKYINHAVGGYGCVDPYKLNVPALLYIVGLTFSFCHCKNVAQRQVVHASAPAAIRSHDAPPKVTYHVLDIEPMRQVLRAEGQSETQGAQKSLHICRGHFASYTEEKPLFGKLAGTFWVPDHVKGNARHGEVVKDYRVKPANENEADG